MRRKTFFRMPKARNWICIRNVPWSSRIASKQDVILWHVVKKRSCSDDDSESEFTKKTLNQLKKKGPVHFGICWECIGLFFGHSELVTSFTTWSSVSPVRCFKIFWSKTSKEGLFYFSTLYLKWDRPELQAGQVTSTYFSKKLKKA